MLHEGLQKMGLNMFVKDPVSRLERHVWYAQIHLQANDAVDQRSLNKDLLKVPGIPIPNLVTLSHWFGHDSAESIMCWGTERKKNSMRIKRLRLALAQFYESYWQIPTVRKWQGNQINDKIF